MQERTRRLIELDRAHVWHPFTAMRQWGQQAPLVIERAEGCELIDTEGRRYIDGVSSLWCNVHGHRVPEIDDAIRRQLDKVAHTTLLGLASPPSIELAARLCAVAPGRGAGRFASPAKHLTPQGDTRRLDHSGSAPVSLTRVFYSDAGATALEVAFKMAVGYWHHLGQPRRSKFIGLREAYHGDTVGSMSVGFSELFHKPFVSMVFDVLSFANPDACRAPESLQKRAAQRSGAWPSEQKQRGDALREHCLADLDRLLQAHAGEVAAVVIEPVMQGAAGMICQPPGFVGGVAARARQHGVLLIADEVATGFGRTGAMFACEHDGVVPDILCLAKGLTGGYLPVAATLSSEAVFEAFCGEPHEGKTLYHGHTYTGNALGCAAALASLDLFERSPSGVPLLEHIGASARIIAGKLDALRDHPNVLDVRQRGIMVGIELGRDRSRCEPFDFAKRTGAALCEAMRAEGLIIRPLGDVLVLMPIPAMPHDMLERMLDIVVRTVRSWRFES